MMTKDEALRGLTIGDCRTRREAVKTVKELLNRAVEPSYNSIKTELKPWDDAVSRQSAIFLASGLKQDLPDDERIADMVMAHNEGVSEYQTQLSLLPSVTPQPKTGHWILTSDDDLEYCTCSECGYQNGENWMIGSQIKFCQECGAKMQESEEV